jgi:hypothetical protein
MGLKKVIIENRTFLFLSIIVTLFLSAIVNITFNAYAQDNITNLQTTTSNTTVPAQSVNTTTSISDFKTLRDQYLSQWQQLPFQSSFDTFIEPYSEQAYGVYRERPSNIFPPETTSIVLYVEPVGYGFKERVDIEGNILYSFNFTATTTISDSQGNPIIEPIPAVFNSPLNSHNKQTEAFMPITLTLEQPLPIGNYKITYTITDGTSGKKFDIVKDIRILEAIY